MFSKRSLIISFVLLVCIWMPSDSFGIDIKGFFSSLFKQDTKISYENGYVVIVKGENRFVATESEEFEADLRLFGSNRNPHNDDDGPWSIVTHFFAATPLDVNEEIFSRLGCERASLNKATMMQIIAINKEIMTKVNKIETTGNERTCVRIYGTSLTIRKYTLKGKDRTRGWRTTGQFKSNPYKMILLTDIDEIYCD